MALTVDFYKVAKRTNSTFVPDDKDIKRTDTAILKEGCGVLAPTLILHIPVNIPIYQLNYARIREFDRFYWITDWKIAEGVNNWEVTMKVDVLASYKDTIESASFYITRSSAASDTNVIDNMIVTKPMVHRRRVQGSTLWQQSESGFTQGIYVVAVVGSDGVTQFYRMTDVQLHAFANAMFKNNDWLITEGVGSKLAQFGDDVIKTIINPAQYITSVMWFPSASMVPAGTDMVGINLGWWGIELPKGLQKIKEDKLVTLLSGKVTPTAHPDESYGNFLNSCPYRRICVYIPAFGSFWLDAGKIPSGASIECNLQVDFRTGMAYVTLGVRSDDDTLFILDSRYAQVGVSIQVSDMKTNLTGALSSIMSAGTNNLIGNTLGSVADIGNALTQMHVPDVNTMGNFGTTCNTSGTIYAMIYSLRIVESINNTKGKPYCKWGNLKTLGNGYYQILNGDISLTGAYDDEIRQVKNFLESGVWKL